MNHANNINQKVTETRRDIVKAYILAAFEQFGFGKQASKSESDAEKIAKGITEQYNLNISKMEKEVGKADIQLKDGIVPQEKIDTSKALDKTKEAKEVKEQSKEDMSR